MSDISIKKAAFITGISKYINIFLGIFFSAILSRILSPNDYGIVAIVSVFTAFFIVLSNCGLSIAVVQRKDFSQEDIDSVFSFSVYQGLVLSVIFIALAYPISIFYSNSVYIPIVLLLSISIFFNTINAVPNGLLRKEKRFLLIGIRLVVVSILTYGFTIILALLNFKYYALVIQSITSSVLIFLWNLSNVKVHFKLKVDFKVLKQIKGYSGFNFLSNLVNFFTRNLDKLIIGKALGNENLAQYNKAYHFMLYPVQNLTNIITPVLHPILSDFQDNVSVIYEKYKGIVKFLSLTGVLVSAGCFCCSKEIILILYGKQWYSAVNCFHFLSIAIWTQMITGTAGSLFNAVGNTKNSFIQDVISVAIMLSCILIVSKFNSIEIISLGVTIALLINFFLCFFFLIKLTMKRSFLDFLLWIFPDFIIYLILMFSSKPINKFIIQDNLFISFVFKGIIISALYLVLLLIFRQTKYLTKILKRK